jgi:hypothetical protein
MTVTRTYRFHEVFEEEVEAVNARRRRFGRAEVELELEPDVSSQSDARAEGEPIMRPTVGSGLAGLALSGGGIRSASFCLGALQALDKGGCSQERRLSLHSVGRRLHRYLAICRHDTLEG